MSLILKCDGCDRKAEKDRDAATWLSVGPALGQGSAHVCSLGCLRKIGEKMIAAAQRALSDLTVAPAGAIPTPESLLERR